MSVGVRCYGVHRVILGGYKIGYGPGYYILSLKNTQFGAKNAILEPFISQFSLKYLAHLDIKRGHKAA